MSTDPLFARETDRTAEEDQELRSPRTDYPEEPERGAETEGVEPEAGVGSHVGMRPEYVLGSDEEGANESEREREAEVPGEGTAGVGLGRETGYGVAQNDDVQNGVHDSGARYDREQGDDAEYDGVRDGGEQYSGVQGGGSPYDGAQGSGVEYGGVPGSGVQSDGVQSDGVQSNGVQSNGVQGNGVQNDVVLAAEQNTEFVSRWREIQAEFIDDPRQAAEHADHLVAEITKVFAEQAEQERNRLASTWQQKGANGTEELRLVMRRYRGLIDHMLDK